MEYEIRCYVSTASQKISDSLSKGTKYSRWTKNSLEWHLAFDLLKPKYTNQSRATCYSHLNDISYIKCVTLAERHNLYFNSLPQTENFLAVLRQLRRRFVVQKW